MPVIEVAGGHKVNFVRAGSRGQPPVVLMHAVGLDLTWWDVQFASLGRDHDLVAFDMLGHGLSDRLKSPPTFELMAEVLTGVLEHVDAGPANLVGHSVGGMIALTLALARPDLVNSLSLVGTLGGFPDAARGTLRERASSAREHGMAALVPPTLERWFPATFRERRPDVLDRAAKCLLLQDPLFHAGMWEMVATLDLQTRLGELRCPTIIMVGTEDGNAPLEAVRQTACFISEAELHELPGVGHFAPLESPDAFDGFLRRFLTETNSTRS